MSVESMSWALRVPDLTAAEKLLLVGIANHDGDGGAWPSIDTLATYLCCTERNVQLTLRKLCAKGLVTVDVQSGGNVKTRADRRPNLYHLHFDGVKPASPGDEADGVKSSAPRGEVQRADGVKPTSPEPSSNHPEPSARAATDDLPPGFAVFWATYPRKVAKPAARRAYLAALKKATREEIQLGVDRWNACWQNDKTPEDKIPYPATWLNQERWNDPVPSPAAAASNVTEGVTIDWLASRGQDHLAPAVGPVFRTLRAWGFTDHEIAVRMAVMFRGNPTGVANASMLSKLDRVDRFDVVYNPNIGAAGQITLDLLDRAYSAGQWRVKR